MGKAPLPEKKTVRLFNEVQKDNKGHNGMRESNKLFMVSINSNS